MTQDSLHIQKISPLLSWPSASVDTGRKRMTDLFSEQGPDYLPIVFGADVPEKAAYPNFNRRELFYEIDKMACEQFWGALSAVRSGSDIQPAIRPQTGTGTLASLFGLDQDILPDTLPWLQKHLTREQVKKLQPPERVDDLGLMPTIRKIFEFYQTHLPNLPTFIADTQGPFDLAHLIYGDQIFYEMHDDPGLVHHLMEVATQAYILGTECMKRMSGEAHDRAYHWSLYLSASGVRACEDTTTLLSPAGVDEFAIPYLRQALAHFGGGWVHYCGRNDRLMDALLTEVPECKYLNLGNPDKHDMTEVIRRVHRAGKVLYSGPIRTKGQSMEDHFRSALEPLNGDRRGLIFQANLTGEETREPQKAMDLWHRLQDRH